MESLTIVRINTFGERYGLVSADENGLITYGYSEVWGSLASTLETISNLITHPAPWERGVTVRTGIFWIDSSNVAENGTIFLGARVGDRITGRDYS